MTQAVSLFFRLFLKKNNLVLKGQTNQKAGFGL